MNPDKFNIEEALGFGWRTMTSKFGTLFVFVILPIIGSMLLQLGLRFAFGVEKGEFHFEAGYMIKMGLYAIIQYVIQLVLALGMMRVGLKMVNDEEPQWSDYISPVGNYVAYFLATLMYVPMITIGFLLLVVPGIILTIMFHYYAFAIVDKQYGPVQALGLSARITKGAKWKLFLFGLIALVINIAGLICLVVGVIPAAIVTYLASVHIYKQLCKSADMADSGMVTAG